MSLKIQLPTQHLTFAFIRASDIGFQKTFPLENQIWKSSKELAFSSIGFWQYVHWMQFVELWVSFHGHLALVSDFWNVDYKISSFQPVSKGSPQVGNASSRDIFQRNAGVKRTPLGLCYHCPASAASTRSARWKAALRAPTRRCSLLPTGRCVGVLPGDFVFNFFNWILKPGREGRKTWLHLSSIPWVTLLSGTSNCHWDLQKQLVGKNNLHLEYIPLACVSKGHTWIETMISAFFVLCSLETSQGQKPTCSRWYLSTHPLSKVGSKEVDVVGGVAANTVI